MTVPSEPTPPQTIGTQPANSFEVNQRVGVCLKDFVRVKDVISQNQNWLLSADLKVAPYYFSAAQEGDIKSAVGSLDAALDAIDMTFVNRVIGLV